MPAERIIEIRQCKDSKVRGLRLRFPALSQAFAAPDAKQKAIDYACQRFGGSAGEVHVYGDDGVTIERSIVIDGRGQYPQVGGD